MLLPDYFSESALVARLPPGCLFSEKKFKELMNDMRYGNNISTLPKYDEVIKFYDIYEFMLSSKPFYIQISSQKKRINVRLFVLHIVQKFNSLFDEINFKGPQVRILGRNLVAD